VQALEGARGDGVPVVYANDNFGVWDGDAPQLVRDVHRGLRRADGDRRARVGLKVSVLAQACATVDERLERIALEYLEAVAGAFVLR
jgi:hypothetical protein